MTFPTWISTTETVTRANGTGFTANFPASGIQSGDLIIVILERQVTKTQSFSLSSGPTMVGTAISGTFGTSTSSGFIQVYKRVADGTENGAVQNWTSSFNSAGFCDAFATVMVFRGADTTLGVVGWNGTVDNGNSNSPDPSATSTLTAKDYLWVAYACSATASSVSGFPSNYTTGHSSNAVSGGSCGSAIRALNAASENPGAFTFSVSGQWGAFAFAIAPAPVAVAGGTYAIIIS